MVRFGKPDPRPVAQLKEERNVDGLMSVLLRNMDDDMREAAAQALGSLGDTRAVDSLIESLADPAPRVRKEAAKALGKIKAPPSIEHLIRLLVDRSDIVVRAAATALRGFRDSQSFEMLASGISNKDRGIREVLTYLLKIYRDDRAIKPLVSALGDEEWTVRCLALEALGEYRSATAVEAVAAAIRDSNPIVRCEAVRVLGKMEDERVAGWLIDALDDDAVTFYAVQGLDRLRSRSVKEALIASLNRESWIARSSAMETLLAWGWQPESPMQRALAFTVRRDWQGISRVGELATEPLLAALSSGWYSDEVAKALGRVGSEQAAGPLINLVREVHEGDSTLISEEIIAGSLIGALKRLIQRKAAMIETDDLKQAAKLADKTVHYVSVEDGEPSAAQGVRHTTYSCAEVRTLAQAELERRGIFPDPRRP